MNRLILSTIFIAGRIMAAEKFVGDGGFPPPRSYSFLR